MTRSIRRTYKYRLYHHRRNKHLHQAINVAGLIWNHMVALQRRYYRLTGKYIGQSQMQRHLLKLRRGSRFAHWRLLGSQAVQELAQRLHKGYQRFFAYKAGQSQLKAGRPHFKKVKTFKSFVLKQAGWKLLGGNKVKLLGRPYKFSLSRPLEGTIKTVTVKRDNLGRLSVCFSLVQEMAQPEPVEISTSNIGGFDFGLRTFLTDSRGNEYHSPHFFKQGQHEIARLNRALAWTATTKRCASCGR